MALVKLPDVVERTDVVCHDGPLGCKLSQIESGAVVVRSFQRRVHTGEAGPVEASGEVKVGDALMCINEEPIELLTYDDVLDRLRGAERPFTLTFGRTGEEIARQIREQAVAAALKAQKEQEQARSLQLQRQQAAQSHTQAAHTTPPRNGEISLPIRQGTGSKRKKGVGPDGAVYTARDFKNGGPGRFQKQVCAVLVIFVIFVLGSIYNDRMSFLGGVVDEDDLQLYEEWKANKARVEAQAQVAEEERRKDHVFGDFDFEKDAAQLLKEQESWGRDADSNATSSIPDRDFGQGKRGS